MSSDTDNIEQTAQSIREEVEDDVDSFVEHFSSLRQYLKSESHDEQLEAVHCFAAASAEYPELVASASTALVSLLTDSDVNVRKYAALALGEASAAEDGMVISPNEAETLHHVLGDDDPTVRRKAARILQNTAKHDQSVIDPHLLEDKVVPEMELVTKLRAYNAATIVAQHRPLQVVAFTPDLQHGIQLATSMPENESTAHKEDREAVAQSALACLHAVAKEAPDAVKPLLDDVATTLTSDNDEIVRLSLDVMAKTIQRHPDAVLEYHSQIKDKVFPSESMLVRLSAFGVYNWYVREHDETVISDVVEPVIQLYMDVEDSGRENDIIAMLTYFNSTDGGFDPIDSRLDVFEGSLRDEEQTAAVTLFQNTAIDKPELVTEYAPLLEDRLRHEKDYVRGRAARSLSYVGLHDKTVFERFDIDVDRVYEELKLYDSTSQEHLRRFEQEFGFGGEGEPATTDSEGEEEVTDFLTERPETTFDDYVGMPELKDTAVTRIIDPLENADLYDKFGVDVDRGFMFHGPPGTGKTYFARALAGECDFAYMEVNAADVVSKWIGQGAKNISKLFEQAIDNQPCLIFIDEIDALATSRGVQQTKSERQMVNQLLQSMTTLNQEEHDVIVIGATNRLDDVDEALVRSGRLGNDIYFGKPEGEARVDIFKMHCKPDTSRVDEAWLAQETEGLVQSDMAKLADEASYEALQRYKQSDEVETAYITQSDVREAIATVRDGEKRSERLEYFG